MINQQSTNGQLFICNTCHKIHLEFNSIGINFEELEQLKEFHQYLLSVNGAYYDELNKGNNFRRKIQIPISGKDIKILVTYNELKELIALIGRFSDQMSFTIQTDKICSDFSKKFKTALN